MSRTTREECENIYAAFKEAPPCDECLRRCDTELHPANAFAWEVWNSLNEFDRPFMAGMDVAPLPIPSMTMAELTAGLGGTRKDYEKVKLIERAMWPAIKKLYDKK